MLMLRSGNLFLLSAVFTRLLTSHRFELQYNSGQYIQSRIIAICLPLFPGDPRTTSCLSYVLLVATILPLIIALAAAQVGTQPYLFWYNQNKKMIYSHDMSRTKEYRSWDPGNVSIVAMVGHRQPNTGECHGVHYATV